MNLYLDAFTRCCVDDDAVVDVDEQVLLLVLVCLISPSFIILSKTRSPNDPECMDFTLWATKNGRGSAEVLIFSILNFLPSKIGFHHTLLIFFPHDFTNEPLFIR